MKGLKKHPLLVRFVVWVCVPLGVLLVAAFVYLRGSLPPSHEEIAVDGLGGRVQIVRDANGVPYVRAQSDRDAYFAMGYLHAQDRLWQLEMARRLAQGRLSEVLGRKALQEDTWMRTLDLYGSARSAWSALSADAQASLQAYADGVNAYLAQKRTLPPEFLLLGVKPEPWKPIDSLAWFKVFALSQSDSMREEVNRYVARKYLPEAQWHVLDREYPANAPVTVDVSPAIQGLAQIGLSLENDLSLGGKYVGSNAWVVSGALTATGAPMLANDPHMRLQMPSIWYAANLSAPGFMVSGMSVIGLPNIIFGRNQSIAWGGTNMMADTQDLYVLDTEPGRPNAYMVDGKWQAMDIRKEEIRIKADFPALLRNPEEPVKIQIRSTRFGPVVSDVLGTVDQPVALRWPGLDPNDTSYEGIFRLAYAHDWPSFNEALSHIVAPAINVVYADTANNIGYVGAGRIPLRGMGDGALPVPASDPRYAWRGYIPFAKMPRAFNPTSGFFVSANNKVIGDAYPYFISRDWAPPARATRITQMIKSTAASPGKIRQQDMERMQADVKDLEEVGLKDYLVSLLSDGKPTHDALGMLVAWDGSMAGDQAPAALFSMWLKTLKDQLLLDPMRRSTGSDAQMAVLRAYVAGVTPTQVRRMMESGAWCTSGKASAKPNCVDIASIALDDAVAQLQRLQGGRGAWRWDAIHKATFRHLPFSDVHFLDHIFGRSIPSPGSENSVDVAGSQYKDKEGFEQNFGAVFRQVISMAPGGRHDYMNSTGQSGNPLSRHYDDMLHPFNEVSFHSIHEPAAEKVESTLTLDPDSASTRSVK